MRKERSMLEGPLLSGILLYTVPVILTSVLQLLFNAADLVVVGRFCGSLSVAAVGATTSLTNLLVNFFIGLSVGAGVAVAHGLGSRENDWVARTVHTALPLALVCGVVVTVLGVGLSETFLKLMGTPEDILPLSGLYMKIYFAGITFTMVYNFCAAILRAAGDTRSPLLFLTFAGVINVALNVVFVTVFQMNVAGVALATTVSQGISAVLVLRALMKRTDACRLELKKLRFHGLQIKKIVRIGLPAGVQSALFGISNVLIQSSVNSFGAVFVSGNAAAMNIEGFLYASLNAFHQTAVNYIGQNTGARRYDRISKILGICYGCVVVLGLSIGAAMWSMGPKLLSLYITDSADAIGYGMIRMTYMALPYFLCGLMDVSTGALRGLGVSLVPMLISVLGVCGIRILWVATIFQLPGFHTPQCLYLSYIVSWTVTLICQTAAFMLVYRRHRAHALT